MTLPDENIIKAQRRMLDQYADEIKALHNLVKEQDKKIIDLAFDLAYAQRSDEWLRELEQEGHQVELSDAEIEDLYQKSFDWDGKNLWSFNFMSFAKTLLEKASEK